MKYYFLFIFLFCVSFLEAQNQDSLWNSSLHHTKILKGADGTTYWCIDGDTVSYSKHIPRKELRSSRDMFFYQRGDTVYFLYDPTDSLQYMDPGQSVYWYSRPLTLSEKDYDILDVEEDWDLFISFHFDLKVPLKIVSEKFVRQKRAVAREELLAFFYRERYRRQEAYKRTRNDEYIFYNFNCCVADYFLVKYIFIPIDGDKYKLYKLRR